MKLLLINPPKDREASFATLDDYTAKARSDQPPLGLMYLYSYLSDKVDVSIVDMNIDNSVDDIGGLLDLYKPDLVGITCVISKWLTVIELARRIKEYSKDIQVVVGGVNPSLYTYETLQCKDIDYAVRGFGQIPLLALCQQYIRGVVIDTIDNCYTRKNYPSRTPGAFSFEDIDNYPLPDRSVLSPADYTLPYFPENPTTSAMSSFGCPFACHFCQCRTFAPIIVREPEKVVAELKDIQDLGIKSVMFQDELFTMSRNRIKSICSLMISEGISLHWSVRARANPIDPDCLDLMRQAGCFNIHMGIESGNPRILKKMNKKTTPKEIMESIKRIKEAGMLCTASFMLGYPTETKEEILETIDFAAAAGLNSCQFYVTIPSPRTLLYKEWQAATGYEGDYFSKFTESPDAFSLGSIIASDIFSKEEMDSFLELGFSKTRNLYNLKDKTNV